LSLWNQREYFRKSLNASFPRNRIWWLNPISNLRQFLFK
jgi:hypothetical protein